MTNDWIVKQLKHNSLVHAVALSAAILACYYGLWRAFFTSDDFWMLGWVRQRATLGEAVWAQFGYGLRFILDAILWTRVRLFDLDPMPYYWISLFQHVIVTLIIYGLVNFWTRRRAVAFVTALLFGTSFSFFEVVTWITGSNYSLSAIPYLTALALFGIYLQRRTRPWYLAALGMFIVGLLLAEFSISLPLIFLAYHLTLGRSDRPIRSLGWRDLRLHLPYWILLGLYMLVQFRFAQSGSSEAVVAQQVYRPGLHMVGNLFYLAYLVVPPYLPGVITFHTGSSLPQWGMSILVIVGGALAVYGLWKGSALVRFAVAFIYLSFLPFTLWEGDFAGAIRYRYLPAIGFSLLLSLFLVRLYDTLGQRRTSRSRLVVPALVGLVLVANVILIQVWVQRHLDNSAVRRAVVTDLATRYGSVEPGTRMYIEVSSEKFVDLGDACSLVFRQPVRCEAFVSGERSLADVIGAGRTETIYWLSATADGIRQVYPPALDAR